MGRDAPLKSNVVPFNFLLFAFERRKENEKQSLAVLARSIVLSLVFSACSTARSARLPAKLGRASRTSPG
jgi:hypothetical protein